MDFRRDGAGRVFVARSAALVDLARVADSAAKTDSAVLISGELGVGKKLFAQRLHYKSPRQGNAFVRLNCALLDSPLGEDQLVDSVRDAGNGTLFLDEVGDIPLGLQAKLLEALQSKKISRSSSGEEFALGSRLVCATSKDLELMAKEGKFLEALLRRLGVVSLRIPPLRERREDVKPLADFFLRKFSAETKKAFKAFSPDAEKALCEYYWPGNVRELENAVERACVLGTPPFVGAQSLCLEGFAQGGGFVPQEGLSLKDAMAGFKKYYVGRALQTTGGRQADVAKALGIQRTYLSRLLTELGIRQ